MIGLMKSGEEFLIGKYVTKNDLFHLNIRKQYLINYFDKEKLE
jgi:hypothetical protein